MPKLVDLTAAPYNLDEGQIAWVEETLADMTLDEQVGQLFTNLFFFGVDEFSGNPYTAEEIIEKFHIGIARYHGGTSDKVQDLLNRLQRASKIPLLIAANCDSGGNGAMSDGTYVASGAQTEATGSVEVARNAGYVSGREMRAIGANLNFDPCVDILKNWRNTIVNTRAYGTTADDVIKYTIPFVEGQRESGILTCVKHWPGDGTEERDQHLILGVNELQPDEWDASFGKVYQAHIANGVEMVMAGHIALPYYQQKLNPELADADILPATLADELLNGLLKTQLGFNGAVITDASHMLGMTSAMRREDYVPLAIAAGCDAFLFFNNLEEDFGFMKAGVENGIITKERLDDANRRVLGLKAKLRLHEKQAAGTLLTKRTPADLEAVGCEEHLRMRDEAADLGITLVKNTLDQLPLNPTDHKRDPDLPPDRREGRHRRRRRGPDGQPLCGGAAAARLRACGQRRHHQGERPYPEVPRRGGRGADPGRDHRLRGAEQLPHPVEDRHEQRMPVVRLGGADLHGQPQLHHPPA